LVGLNACSDASTAPVAARTLTRPSFITVDQIPAGFAPEAGKIKVCKVWDNPGAGTIPNTTINRTGNDVTPTAATLTLTAGPYVLGHNQCANVATSTEGNGIFDDVTLTETVPAGHSLVQVQRFDFGGATSVIANGAAIGFNTFHGSTIVFTNHFTPPPPPVCDRYTFGGWVNEKPNHISYGVNAGLNDAGLAWGDFEVNNHANGDKIHVWNVTAYGVPVSGPLAGVPNARFASGPAEVNGVGGHTAEFRFVDNGEPGTDDQVWLAVDGSQYFPLQTVNGGNIQLHEQCKKAPKDEKQ